MTSNLITDQDSNSVYDRQTVLVTGGSGYVGSWAIVELLKQGYGVTNVVMRATATADELTREELREGGKRLVRKVRRYRPTFLAVLGLGAYRAAWDQPKAVIGEQEKRIGETTVWVLPNPSGLNAHYQAKELARLFSELRDAVELECLR